MASFVSRLVDRWSVERQEKAVLDDPRAEADCEAIESCPPRGRVDVHGVLRSVTVRPVDNVTALEAELHDGTGSVTLVWLGRRSIVGISSGRSLTATGRIGRRGSERVMYNPAYWLDA